MNTTEIMALMAQDYKVMQRNRKAAEQRARSSDPIQRRAGEVKLADLDECKASWLLSSININRIAAREGVKARLYPDGSTSAAAVGEERKLERRDSPRQRDSVRSMQRQELRTTGTTELRGYAAKFYDPTDPGTQYALSRNVVERIAPTAFDRTLSTPDEVERVILVAGHDPNLILARVGAGTLKLNTDATGLYYRAKPAMDSPIDKHFVSHVARGDIAGSSFQFMVRDSRWTTEGKLEVRELLDLELHDTTITPVPAYQSATVTVA
jgi:HK97 family phage prohead protease